MGWIGTFIEREESVYEFSLTFLLHFFPSFFPSASGGDEIKPRRKTLTLLQRGLEVRGFFDTENALQWTKKQHQKVVSFESFQVKNFIFLHELNLLFSGKN